MPEWFNWKDNLIFGFCAALCCALPLASPPDRLSASALMYAVGLTFAGIGALVNFWRWKEYQKKKPGN